MSAAGGIGIGFGAAGVAPTEQAATVVLLRDAQVGIEVLVLRKNRGMAFGGNWVFPGGKVDPDDVAAAEALGVDAAEDGEGVARVAAVREAAEETGLDLDPDSLVTLSHWTPPPEAARRFLTWFFLAAAPTGEVIVDGGEIGDHVWTTPADALAGQARGEVLLAPPTWVTLHDLLDAPGAAGAVAALRSRTPVRHESVLADDDGTAVILWAPDAAHGGAPLSTPGPRHRLLLHESGGYTFERSP